MKKRLLLLTVILIFSLTVLTACGTTNNQNGNAAGQNPAGQSTNEPNNNAANNNQGAATVPNNNAAEQNNTQNTNDNTYDESRSQAISDAVRSEITQAKDVWVMVTGQSAYVALDIPSEDTANEAQSLKNQVAEVVAKTDESITDVYVTEDADSFTRVKDTFGDLVNGHPISGLTDEITNLFTRITPTRASK